MGAAWSSIDLGVSRAALEAAFGAGVLFGAATAATRGAASDTLDAVCDAAQAVKGYLLELLGIVKNAGSSAHEGAKSAAAAAYEELKKAAASVADRVVDLVRRLLGSSKAAAAKREMDDRAAAGSAGPDVFADASAHVASSGRRIMDVSWALVPAAPPGALALVEPVSVAARRAAISAAEMMDLLLMIVAAESNSIPGAARPFIAVIAAAAAMCLDLVSPPPVALTAKA